MPQMEQVPGPALRAHLWRESVLDGFAGTVCIIVSLRCCMIVYYVVEVHVWELVGRIRSEVHLTLVDLSCKVQNALADFFIIQSVEVRC